VTRTAAVPFVFALAAAVLAGGCGGDAPPPRADSAISVTAPPDTARTPSRGTGLADSASPAASRDTPPGPDTARGAVPDTAADSGRTVRPQIDSGRIDRPDVTIPRPGGAEAPEARARRALDGIRDSIELGTRRPALRTRAREIYDVTSFSPQLRADAAGLAGRAYLEDSINDSARVWVRRAIALDPKPSYVQLLERIPD
jgi:hypothetical protein